MWLETVHDAAHHAEKCPTCGGGVQQRVFGEVYAGSFVQNGERVEIRRVPHPEYRNPVILDPLTQYFNGGLYRVFPSETYYTRGGKKLHRDAWNMAFGPIPDRCHIHHRDGNPANNALDNLECIDPKEHLRHHPNKLPRTFNATARERAAEWHRSEAGRIWHRRHAQRQQGWTKWKRVSQPCAECNSQFDALARKGNAQKYCSTGCKVAAYRKRSKA
jgi:endogenous inhibitor of DNA gyrase (YacG/DUF329 family)